MTSSLTGYLMLAPAHAGHLPTLRALIRVGASEGSFDRELATISPESQLFFANLRQALQTGYFIVEDARGVIAREPASGYVYWPADDAEGARPVGFGLFKAFGEFGHELWLTAVDPTWRGNGHGRRLLSALLATPAGRRAWIVRVQRGSDSAAAMEHLLAVNRFVPARDTPSTRWFVRDDAPPLVAETIRAAPLSQRAQSGLH
jgi:GNAT superfamily N-acetyltransferase